MSKWLGGVLLLAGLGAGYAGGGSPTLAQGVAFPVNAGEVVTLHLDPSAGGFPCTVVDVRGDFLGCKGSARQPDAEDWYNIRQIGRIHRDRK